MISKIIHSPRPGWSRYQHAGMEVFQAGNPIDVRPLLTQLANDARDIQKIGRVLTSVKGHFALIIDGPQFCFACTDHCRSSPIFYHTKNISNDAHKLRAAKSLNIPNNRGVRDAAMAGFVTGPHTLFLGLSQLEAGTYALWHTDQTEPLIYKHSVYQPEKLRRVRDSSLITDFMSIVDHTITKTISSASGRPIWVALSGGLDSRLLLAKLVSHGCSNLHAFTYGPRGSQEAIIAKQVAERLSVKWTSHISDAKSMKVFFSNSERRKYWAFCDGLSAVPNFQDYLPLKLLKERGEIPAGAVVINGQTGDFISGGHIPMELMEKRVSFETLFKAIIKKHFSLWDSLKTPSYINEIREEFIIRFNCNPKGRLERDEAVAFYEQFEYEERQAKYVINGQRNYEFLGLNWALPLWDPEVVGFWRNVPIEHKYQQALYRSALKAWNYRGVFQDIGTKVGHWPGMMRAILGPSRLLRLVFGASTRDAYLKRMLYFGLYRDQYAPFGYRHFLRNASDLRNPVSLLSRTWLTELGLKTIH